MSKLNLKLESLLPFHFRVLSLGFIIISPIMWIQHPILGIIFLVLGILGLTTHYRVEFDNDKKKVQEYVWLAGFRKGTIEPYLDMEAIYINKLIESSGFGYVTRITTENDVYKTFILIRNADNIEILEDKHENKAIGIAEKVSNYLNLPVVKNYES